MGSRTYGAEEVFCRVQGFRLGSGSVAMQIASGRVRRKTALTGPGEIGIRERNDLVGAPTLYTRFASVG